MTAMSPLDLLQVYRKELVEQHNHLEEWVKEKEIKVQALADEIATMDAAIQTLKGSSIEDSKKSSVANGI